MKVPSLNYIKVIKAFQRDNWTVVSQKGSHIKLQKRSNKQNNNSRIHFKPRDRKRSLFNRDDHS